MTAPHARRVADTALTLAAVLGSLCLVVTVLGAVWGVRPLVFRSGSMGPAIGTGALAFAHPVEAADLAVGDVVSVPVGDTRVTHRITAVEHDGDTALLVLKGDANLVVDREPYRVRTADRVVFAVPHVGRVLGWWNGPVGWLLGGAMVAALAWVLIRPTPGRRGRRLAGKRSAATAVIIAAGLAVPVTAGGPDWTLTWATWTDRATATGSASAHTATSQANPSCNDVSGVLGLGDVARLTWSHVDERYEYLWEVRRTTGTLVTSGVVPVSAQAQGSTVTLDVSTTMISSNGDYNVVVRARLKTTPGWAAATATTTPVRRTSILGLGASIRCGHG